MSATGQKGKPDGGADTPANGGDALVMTVREAARLLHISRNTCYELVRRGELPAVKLGSRILRVPRRGLEQWLAREAGLPSPPSPVVDLAPSQRH